MVVSDGVGSPLAQIIAVGSVLADSNRLDNAWLSGKSLWMEECDFQALELDSPPPLCGFIWRFDMACSFLWICIDVGCGSANRSPGKSQGHVVRLSPMYMVSCGRPCHVWWHQMVVSDGMGSPLCPDSWCWF
ncbi:hypothetical protein GOP47_0022417 [Adiantum capillus-veneris]|uniref:Uncharacterized protein n=1 Tax=Adiantum capillus-veneris TaxID=13818 RepID=A0A9D4U6G6_ADICA|nr:hypothetical protein GOP47_0022417 [Adiantum capillus-veneris]